MTPLVFVDTNILVYAISSDARAVRAEALLQGRPDTSVQALNEFANVARRKLGLDWDDLKTAIGAFRALCGTIHPMDIKTHERALELAERYGFSTFDALMVAAARQAGCMTLYSEDMQDGLVVEGALTIVNPFQRPAPA